MQASFRHKLVIFKPTLIFIQIPTNRYPESIGRPSASRIEFDFPATFEYQFPAKFESEFPAKSSTFATRRLETKNEDD